MAHLDVRLGGQIIGRVALAAPARGERTTIGEFFPGPEFTRLEALFDELQHSRAAAERQAASPSEREEFRRLADEVLGFWVLDEAGQPLARALELQDVSDLDSLEPDWRLTVIYDRPQSNELGSGERPA